MSWAEALAGWLFGGVFCLHGRCNSEPVMTDIPDDIMEAAEKTLDLMCCNCREAGDVRADSILDIARAILSERQAAEKRGEQRERERAARLVMTEHDRIVAGTDGGQIRFAAVVLGDLAAAIRNT